MKEEQKASPSHPCPQSFQIMSKKRKVNKGGNQLRLNRPIQTDQMRLLKRRIFSDFK